MTDPATAADALRNQIRNIESTMRDPATKSSEIENLRPHWLRLKARLAKLACEAPTAFTATVQWKDSDDAPATVTIALTDDPGEDADGDDSVFYYAGRMTEAEARAAFSRDASPEDWYIA